MPARFWLPSGVIRERSTTCHCRTVATVFARTLVRAFDQGALAVLRLSRVVLICLAGLLTSITNSQAFHTDEPNASASLSDVIAFVDLQGWTVDLGYLCHGLSLNEGAEKCLFRQIAVHSRVKKEVDHGFNVPIDQPATAPLLVYRVTPLIGEFLLLSVDGSLVRAFFRARGEDFNLMSEKRAADVLKAELTFWKNSLAQIEHDVLARKSKFNSFQGRRQ